MSHQSESPIPHYRVRVDGQELVIAVNDGEDERDIRFTADLTAQIADELNRPPVHRFRPHKINRLLNEINGDIKTYCISQFLTVYISKDPLPRPLRQGEVWLDPFALATLIRLVDEDLLG